jgi:hypothetical protein
MRDDVADGSGPVLVGTKLRPLTVRDQVVPRERLMERLRGGSGLGLSLVACPPGYGETTLLAAWHEVEAARKPVAWLTLDEDDNNPAVHLRGGRRLPERPPRARPHVRRCRSPGGEDGGMAGRAWRRSWAWCAAA